MCEGDACYLGGILVAMGCALISCWAWKAAQRGRVGCEAICGEDCCKGGLGIKC